MKRILLFSFFCFALAFTVFGQSPEKFKFQAVARDASNVPFVSANLAIRVSLVRDGVSGLVDYSERHEVTTSPLGVFDLEIGGGVLISGMMSNVDWGMHSYYLKIDIDPTGGNTYTNLGTSQLLSVPYAIYAREAANGGGGNPTDELQNLIYDAATQTLTLTDGNSVTLNVSGGTDSQTLVYDQATGNLSITNGNTINLPAGQTGPAGPQGEQGPAGPQGPAGAQGPQGEQGPAGQDGTGVQIVGTVATVGDLPASGNPGDLYIVQADGDGYVWDGSMWTNVGQIQGPQGPQGPQGQQGPAGAQGPQGNQGAMGAAGPQGTQGPQGEQGPAGPAGAQGPQGEQGPMGATGPQGSQGEQGPAGPQGPAGQDGTGVQIVGTVATVGDLPASSNQGDLYIVEADGNGYVWDGSMWTNVGQIQGPQGPQGPMGIAGAQGPQGEQGPAGPAGAQGPQGEQGPAGQAGAQGPQGEQGPMGNTGAQGLQGEQGPAGPQGPQGEQGQQGPMGNTGTQGPQGEQGPAGPAGTQGPQGEQGPIGNTGATGPQGPQGEQGPQGAQGPQGMQGDPGSYLAGSGIHIASSTISAFDVSATNELQSLSLSGSNLSISNGNSVNLSGVGGSSLWSESGSDIYYNGGDVGIGTSSPGNKLHLVGDLRIDDGTPSVQLYNGGTWLGYMFHDGSDVGIGNILSNSILFQTGGLTRGTLDSDGLSLTSGGQELILNPSGFSNAPTIDATGNNLQVATAGMSISASGSVTSTPYVLRIVESDVYGLNIYNGSSEADWEQYVTTGGLLSLYADNSFRGSFDGTTGAYTAASDRRLKRDIRPLESSLEAVMALQPSRYAYIANNPTNKTSIGFVAQDVQALYPELVLEQKGERDDGLLSVNYAGFSVLAIKAIQEQQELITKLETELQAEQDKSDLQQTQIQALEERLERLEALLKQ